MPVGTHTHAAAAAVLQLVDVDELAIVCARSGASPW